MTSIAQLYVVKTGEQLLASVLATAAGLGLPVTSWRAGDPTRATFKALSEQLATREQVTSEFVKSGFLDDATGDWLRVVASQLYGVTPTDATYAAPTVTLTNAGGGFYPVEPGDLTAKSTASGKTFHSTTGGTLSAGATLAFAFEADEAGADSSVAVNEVDELVTSLLGVTVVSSTASLAVDEQEEEAIRVQCRATLGALSPNGPPDAYEYVARNVELTGAAGVTKAHTVPDSSTGIVLVYVAGPTGPVTAPEVALVQAAIEQWATPLCMTPTVASASAVTVAVTATITGDDLPAGLAASAETAIDALFALCQIKGTVTRSAIIACLQALTVALGATNVSVSLAAPAADVTTTDSQVAVAGTVTIS
jgi:hypothetical protein